MSKEEKPKIEDVEMSYPWGKKTATNSAVILLLAFNLILFSTAFLINTEIPFILGERGSPGEPMNLDWEEACNWIIGVNIAIVITTKVVGGWLNTQVQQCKLSGKKCKWWCLCCNKWLCWLAWVLKWVTWIVTIVSTIVTSVAIFSCWFIGLF